MKEIINSNIKDYLIRIMIVYICVMISIPVWLSVGNSSYSKTAKYYENYNENIKLSFIVENN